MNTKRISVHLGLALLFLGTVCVTASAATLTVGKETCPNAQYSTIASAISAAAPGDIIDICPALYPEQLVISKPLTLRGVRVNVAGNDVKRILIQPFLQNIQDLPVEAVITVMNASYVTIDNLAIDGSQNSVSGCTPGLAAVHYFNSSGRVINNAIFGAQFPNPQSCSPSSAPGGNGIGVQVDADQSRHFHVSVENNSIHDYSANGIRVDGSGVTAEIEGNNVSGVGPSIGTFQFGVLVVNGAVAQIKGNVITEGRCGTLSATDCFNIRSEGVTLRLAGDGTVVDSNVITDAQSGVFINAVNNVQITNNFISNIDALDGIDMQGTSNSLLDGNTIVNATIGNESCGVYESPGPGFSGGIEENNKIAHTNVNDSYCGVAHVSTSRVESGTFHNTLFTDVNSETFAFPPPVEP
ncbi:MAG: right-handed parallel beta-helix repeat-containing protein [Terriglobales bacterium]